MLGLLILGILLVLAYEVWAIVTQRASTISEIVWRTAATSPLLPFLAGLLMGHLFW
jgi:hypothetical protein